jgi:adenosylhomocysteinase
VGRDLLGHPGTDLGITLQARCLELVAKGGAGAEQCVVPVPKEIDAAVASAYLALNRQWDVR